MNTSLLLLGAMAIACSSGNCTTVVHPGVVYPYAAPMIVERPIRVGHRPIVVSHSVPAPRPVVHQAPAKPVHHVTPSRPAQKAQPKPSGKAGHGPSPSHSKGRK